MNESEERLIQKAKAGDKDAFGKLVKKYHQKMLYVAYDLMGNYEDAKDLAQETFLRAFLKLSQFQERAQFSTWLYRVLYNLAIDTHRRKKRTPVRSLEETITGDLDRKSIIPDSVIVLPNEQVDNEELGRQINEALDHLTFNQRTAVILRYYHQKSSKEISDVMGCAESTVRIHIFRALAHMKKYLGEYKPD